MTPTPRLVWRVTGERTPLGALVVDRSVAGRSCGGVRAVTAVDLSELADLARTMTFKFAFLGIACGGAKAGVVIPPDATAADRERRMRAFGAALAPLVRTGAYVAGTDMGTGAVDLWAIRDGAGLPAGARPSIAASTWSATAAYSGRSAAVAALVALERLGRSPTGASLAIAGYGRVGAALASRFVAGGGRLVAASTTTSAVVDPDGLDPARLDALRDAYGDDAPLRHPGRHVRPEEVLDLPVDVLAPCATRHMVDAGVRPRCRVVTCGANAALAPAVEEALAAAGIVVIPDFLASAGGILVSHFWPLDPPPQAAVRLIERRFRGIVAALFTAAARAGDPPAARARMLATANLERLERAGAGGLRHERVLSRLGAARVRRLLPARVRTGLVTWLARALHPAVARA